VPSFGVRAEVVTAGGLVDVSEWCESAEWSQGRFGGLEAHRAGTCSVFLSAPEGAALPVPRSVLAANEALAGRVVRLVWVDEQGDDTGVKELPFLAWRGWIDEVDVRVTEGLLRVELRSVDALGRLAGTHVVLPAGTPAETTGARIGRILDLAGWPTGDARSLDAGATVCSELSEAVGGDAAVLCAQTADTEPGRFYATLGQDVSVLRFDRSGRPPGRWKGAVITDMADSVNGAHWAEFPEARADRELLATRVVFEDAAGTTETVSDADAVAALGDWTVWRKLWTDVSRARNVSRAILKGTARSRVRVVSARLAPHADTHRGAVTAAEAQVGGRAAVRFTRAGKVESSEALIDGKSVSVRPLDQARRRVEAHVELALIPTDLYVPSSGLVLLPPDVPDLIVGRPAAIPLIAATGGAAPVAYAAVGLPAGLALSGLAIRGTPTAVGASEVTLTATDSTTPDALSQSVVFTVRVVRSASWAVAGRVFRVRRGGSASFLLPQATGVVGSNVTYSAHTGTVSGLSASFGRPSAGTVRMTLTSAAPTEPSPRSKFDDVLLQASEGGSTAAATVRVVQYVPLSLSGGRPVEGTDIGARVTVPLVPVWGGGGPRSRFSVAATGFTVVSVTPQPDRFGRLLVVGVRTAAQVRFAVTVRDPDDPQNSASETWTMGAATGTGVAAVDRVVSEPPGVGGCSVVSDVIRLRWEDVPRTLASGDSAGSYLDSVRATARWDKDTGWRATSGGVAPIGDNDAGYLEHWTDSGGRGGIVILGGRALEEPPQKYGGGMMLVLDGDLD